ncbi:hypothetical protein MY4038_008386 [Beauveria bassiana]
MATPITTSSARASGSSTKTFRITGVPNGWDKEELRSFMGNYFQDVSIQSLAPRIDGGSGQATAILGDQVRNANPSGTSTIGGLTWDTDFVGMTTLFAPPQDDHKLDIIAVSGLGGHAFGSFKERGGSHMWLRDSLPYEILDKVTKRPMARVIIYGHRSDVAQSTTIQGFPDISASLLHSLRPLAAETPTTPIMFIGHSLGGILIKQADEPAESLLLMQWICFAQDVMTVQELRWAIVIDVERPGVDDPKKSLVDFFDDEAYIEDDEAMIQNYVREPKHNSGYR